MVDFVEERADVDVNHPALSFLNKSLRLLDCLLCAHNGAKSIAILTKRSAK
ncbi:MAG: hypothetical protein V3V18_14585 [Methylococcales bacterium]